MLPSGFAFATGELSLLQSRPVTGVEFSWDADVDDWQTARQTPGGLTGVEEALSWGRIHSGSGSSITPCPAPTGSRR